MLSLVLVGRLTLLQLEHQLPQVFLQHTTDVPFVHLCHDVVELDLLLIHIIGKVEGRHAKLVEEAAFHHVAVVPQDADAAEIGLGHLDICRIAHPFSFRGRKNLCRKTGGA